MIEFNKEEILRRGGLKMTLQQILYAITISEFGSMNKAAEALFIAQPTLTNAIKELERENGQRRRPDSRGQGVFGLRAAALSAVRFVMPQILGQRQYKT